MGKIQYVLGIYNPYNDGDFTDSDKFEYTCTLESPDKGKQ